MRIELLYCDGCPNFETLASTLRTLLAGADIDDDVEMRRIASIDDAKEKRFLGSPTVRIEGEDVERAANARTDFGLKCRLYRTSEGLYSVPPTRWIAAAIQARQPDDATRSGRADRTAIGSAPSTGTSRGSRLKSGTDRATVESDRSTHPS